MGSRTNIEFSDKAHENMRNAVRRYKVPQKHMLNALMEHWSLVINEVHLAPIMAELKASLPKRGQSADALAKAAGKLSPEDRDKLRRALDGA